MSDTLAAQRTVKDIIKAAGGPTAIAEASQGAVTADAVYKWSSIGIPDRHWLFIMPMAGATADEMVAANAAARSEQAA